jgi:nucleoside 2-deoxyribosyltransferase
MKPRDVYLAGPFFSPVQVEELERVEALLRLAGITYFSPRIECRYNPGDPPSKADQAFFLNVHHVSQCKFVLAGLTWPDAGTGWELGMAHEAGIARLGFTSNRKAQMNLMVVKTVDALIMIDTLDVGLGAVMADIQRGKTVTAAIQGLGDHGWKGYIE